MEEKLVRLLDYQRFQKNSRLEELLQELERRYGEELPEDSLSMVSAAGEAWLSRRQKNGLMEDWNEE